MFLALSLLFTAWVAYFLEMLYKYSPFVKMHYETAKQSHIEVLFETRFGVSRFSVLYDWNHRVEYFCGDGGTIFV